MRFCNIRYLAISLASGNSMPSSTFSLTIVLPFSVSCVNLTPRVASLSAICCLLPGLNGVTLSFKALPVFSLILSSTSGGKVACSSPSISATSPESCASNTLPLVSSNLKPYLSCLWRIAATSCSSCTLSPQSSNCSSRYLYNSTVTATSCLQ